jgi:hypothetical protein
VGITCARGLVARLRDRLLEGRYALRLTRVMACAVLGSWLYRQDLLAIFERHDQKIPLFLYLPLHNVGYSPPPPPPPKKTNHSARGLSLFCLVCDTTHLVYARQGPSCLCTTRRILHVVMEVVDNTTAPVPLSAAPSCRNFTLDRCTAALCSFCLCG